MNNENEHQDSTLYRHAPEKIWLNLEEAKCGYDDLFPMDSDKDIPWKRLHWEDEVGVEYIRADLAGQWKPMPFPTPEDFKDGREVTLMAGIDYSEGHIDEVPRMVTARWDKWYGEEVGWAIVNNFTYTIFAVNPTHYFDFGTVALPTAPQAEAEEGE